MIAWDQRFVAVDATILRVDESLAFATLDWLSYHIIAVVVVVVKTHGPMQIRILRIFHFDINGFYNLDSTQSMQ